MFEASAPFVLFDELRIPYEVRPRRDRPRDGDAATAATAGYAELRPLDGTGKRLRWPDATTGQADDSARLGSYRLRGIPFFARMAPNRQLEETAAGQGWEPVSQIDDATGEPVGSIWRQPDGSLVLPFDPNEAMQSYWMEAYRDAASSGSRPRLRRLAMRGYYQIRPLLPRRLQLSMRRAYAGVQARAHFPRWPYEPALHDLVRVLYEIVTEIAGEPPPRIASWPAPHSWALVLTHDVETDVGYRKVRQLRAIEEAVGLRSSWNFVPRRYAVDDDLVAELHRLGFEVGVHGLYHDGHDLESKEVLARRLPEIREWAQRWDAVGFRSPATQRRWEWMDQLGFEYDSSYSDTAPYEPQAGGCCSWLPFFVGSGKATVELPITMEQDHTLFAILGHQDASVWLEKATRLRQRGGMALVLTHPDYLDAPLAAAYGALLSTVREDESVWHALPRDVADWWQRRAATSLVRDGDRWRAIGPGAEQAAIETRPPG